MEDTLSSLKKADRQDLRDFFSIAYSSYADHLAVTQRWRSGEYLWYKQTMIRAQTARGRKGEWFKRAVRVDTKGHESKHKKLHESRKQGTR
jgi:hypothetical protein